MFWAKAVLVCEADGIVVAHGANRGKDRQKGSKPSKMAAYITVFDGSRTFYGFYPHLSMWATNITPSSTVYGK